MSRGCCFSPTPRPISLSNGNFYSPVRIAAILDKPSLQSAVAERLENVFPSACPQHYLHELVIKTLVQHNLFYMLHQFLQYHVLSDSKPLVRVASFCLCD